MSTCVPLDQCPARVRIIQREMGGMPISFLPYSIAPITSSTPRPQFEFQTVGTNPAGSGNAHPRPQLQVRKNTSKKSINTLQAHADMNVPIRLRARNSRTYVFLTSSNTISNLFTCTYIYSCTYRHVKVNHTFVTGCLQTASINTLQVSALLSSRESEYHVCFYELNDCQYKDIYTETQLGSSPVFLAKNIVLKHSLSRIKG